MTKRTTLITATASIALLTACGDTPITEENSEAAPASSESPSDEQSPTAEDARDNQETSKSLNRTGIDGDSGYRDSTSSLGLVLSS